MTYAEFIAKVETLLTVDADRKGAVEFAQELITQGIVDLQSFIDTYRVGKQTVYEPGDLTTEYFASRGALPAGCEPRDCYLIRQVEAEITAVDTTDNTITVPSHGLSSATYETEVEVGLITSTSAIPGGLTAGRAYFLRPVDDDTLSLHNTAADAIDNEDAVDLTSAGSGTLTLAYQKERLPCWEWDWDDRFSLIHGEQCLNDDKPRICIEPYGSTFYVFPEVKALDPDGFSYTLELNWDGISVEWEDDDDVPFLDRDALVVAEFVKSRMERQVKRDLGMATSFDNTYRSGRQISYLDAKNRSRTKS